MLKLFRTNATFPEEEHIRETMNDYLVGEQIECPPFAAESEVWTINGEETEKAGFLERLLGETPDKNKQTAMGTQDTVSAAKAEEQGKASRGSGTARQHK